MKSAAFILFVMAVSAAEIIDVGEITRTAGIGIRMCHPGDRALVEVTPLNPNRRQSAGMFVTTNNLLTLDLPVMTMIPSGTNLAKIRTICGGVTSEVSEARFVIHRPVAAPKVGRSRRVDLASIPSPPLPAGLIPALAGTNDTYAAYRRRLESGKHRSE